MTDLHDFKKIGILGGTFNPIHLGHLSMAERAYEMLGLDVVLLMPSGISYLKAGTGVLSGEVRLQMTKLSISDKPYMQASDIEVLRKGNTYTYETLQYMKQEYSEAELYFIVGADSLFSMDRWVEPAQIFSYCTVVAMGRGNASREALEQKKQSLYRQFDADIIILDFVPMDISSTEIRKRVQEGKSIRHMVPEAVRQFIKENNLYKD